MRYLFLINHHMDPSVYDVIKISMYNGWYNGFNELKQEFMEFISAKRTYNVMPECHMVLLSLENREKLCDFTKDFDRLGNNENDIAEKLLDIFLTLIREYENKVKNV